MRKKAELNTFETFRGWDIEKNTAGQFVYSDNKNLVKNEYKTRPCGHCGLNNTSEGHDGCLCELPLLMNACCGHGRDSDAYVQFKNSDVICGAVAIELQDLLKTSLSSRTVLSENKDVPGYNVTE